VKVIDYNMVDSTDWPKPNCGPGMRREDWTLTNLHFIANTLDAKNGGPREQSARSAAIDMMFWVANREPPKKYFYEEAPAPE